jgi:hypothetical protein
MSKFAIGEKVDNAADDHEVGTVIAVFPTIDGSFMYAVDTEGYGALQFFHRGKTSRSPPCSAGMRSIRDSGGCRDDIETDGGAGGCTPRAWHGRASEQSGALPFEWPVN